MSKPFNGHPSWNAWNVSLWIGNDEGLYNLALDCIRRASNKGAAARLFIREVGTGKTPDGANYSERSVRHALAGLED